MSDNIFEQASRQKLRFESIRGPISAEDLWELPLTSRNSVDLDSIAKGTNARLKATAEESFVATSTNPARAGLELRMEVLKHIIAVRLRENEETRSREARAEEKRRLLEILDSKQDEALRGLSTEDIRKRIAELEKE